ncbi:MAG: DUF1732 domain-containing protein [bacterium]
MIKSMTGYSKTTKEVGGYGTVSFELKSVNGKNLTVNFRMPQELSSLEQSLRSQISRDVKRGTLSVNVNVDYSSEFIESFVKDRINKLDGLSKVKGFEKFSQLIFNDISSYIPLSRRINAKHALQIGKIAADCLKKYDSFRKSEGKEIEKDFIKYNRILSEEMKKIMSVAGGSVEKKRSRLKMILAEKSPLIEQEIILFADKIDISEEISRFNAHLSRLKNEQSGASMSFILQEMLRESNTMSAKSEDLRIIQSVIKIKETMEKIKEQAGNVE